MTAVAIAPDGSWLASGHEDGSVRIWDRATGQERAVLTGQAEAVTAVAIAPDGSWLASGDFAVVRIWDRATGQERAVLTRRRGRGILAAQGGWVTAVAIAPDGSWLASGDFGAVRIWDPATGEQRAVLTDVTGPPGMAKAVAIAPDGSWLAALSDEGSVRIWDRATGQLRAVLIGRTEERRGVLSPHAGWVKAVAIAPDGSWLAAVSDDGLVRIWDPATGGISALMRVDSPLRDCAWSPSGQSLAAAGGAGLYHFTFKP